MPLYVHEVDATVSPAPAEDEPGGAGGHGLSRAQFAAVVEAVARELARRQRDTATRRAETRVTGTNRAAGG
jgi:hypothetical protein